MTGVMDLIGVVEALKLMTGQLFVDLGRVMAMSIDLVFGAGRLEHPAGRLGETSFAISCGVFAVLFVVLDVCIVFIRKKSFLQLEYNLRHGAGLFVAVPLAAAIVGFLGVGLDVLEITRSAGIAVGIGWSFFLAALFNTSEGIGPGAGEDPAPGGEPL